MKRILFALAFAGPLTACGVSEELYNARVNELQKLKADLDEEQKAHETARNKCRSRVADLEEQNGSLRERLEALGQNMKELESSKSSLATDLDTARRRMEELRKAHEQAELRAQQFRQLFAKFKSMIDSGKLKVEIRNGLMLVKLADNILFDPGRVDLKPIGKDALKEVATILIGISGRKFQVAGHTDNQTLSRHSAFKSNWELSTARAVQVVHFMIEEGGMPGDRLSAAGFADQLPVAANDSDEGRKQNRRIEIVLLPNIEDLPPMEETPKDAESAPK